MAIFQEMPDYLVIEISKMLSLKILKKDSKSKCHDILSNFYSKVIFWWKLQDSYKRMSYQEFLRRILLLTFNWSLFIVERNSVTRFSKLKTVWKTIFTSLVMLNILDNVELQRKENTVQVKRVKQYKNMLSIVLSCIVNIL